MNILFQTPEIANIRRGLLLEGDRVLYEWDCTHDDEGAAVARGPARRVASGTADCYRLVDKSGRVLFGGGLDGQTLEPLGQGRPVMIEMRFALEPRVQFSVEGVRH